ncbi:universal stress protein [Kribbella sp. NPDC050124]|uniref:universal stress protein n=1 Tax=Kribbella sp. NPDC050124 TaxID=3364114 RepID=UPI00378FE313
MTIVVGYDGSPASEAAVRWAADEADRRSWSLRLTYVLPLPMLRSPTGVTTPLPADAVRRTAEKLLGEVAERIRTDDPELAVDAVVSFGSAAEVLLQEATEASMVVVGSRGLGEFRDLAMGSVAAHVATHAPCPVVIIPPRWESGPPTGEVVVGVDGSGLSLDAVEFAYEAAQARRARLIAVMAWHDPVSTGPDDPLPVVYDLDALEQQSAALLAESIAGHRERYPDVAVRQELVHGRPDDVLVAAGRTADLLVVGSRGHGAFRGLLLGSTSRSLVHHAPCPVAVVR